MIINDRISNIILENVENIRTQQSRRPEDESTPQFNPGPLLSEARQQPKEHKTRHQDLNPLETLLLTFQKTQQIP